MFESDGLRTMLHVQGLLNDQHAMRDKLVFKALETELLRWFDPEGPRILRSDVRHFCPSSDNDIVDVLSLGEPRVELKRLAIPKDEGRLSPASSSRSMDARGVVGQAGR